MPWSSYVPPGRDGLQDDQVPAFAAALLGAAHAWHAEASLPGLPIKRWRQLATLLDIVGIQPPVVTPPVAPADTPTVQWPTGKTKLR